MFHRGNASFVAPGERLIFDTGHEHSTLMFSHLSEPISHQLMTPVLPPDFGLHEFFGRLDMQAWSKRRTSRGQTKTSKGGVSFWDLPPEVHEMIMQRMPIDDLFVMGTLSQYFWQTARMLLHRKFASSFGQLAGKPLALVCGDATSDDLPPQFLSAKQSKELQDGLTTDELTSQHSALYSSNLYTLAHQRYTFTNTRSPVWKLYTPVVTRCGTLGSNLRQMIEAAQHSQDSYFAPGGSLVLRNLTKREFVRSQWFGTKEEFLYAYHKPNVDSVIFSRVFWNSDTTSFVAGDDSEQHGKWAGDRLDIVTAERFTKEYHPSKWTDVSEVARDEVMMLWRDHRARKFVMWRKKEESQGKCFQKPRVRAGWATK